MGDNGRHLAELGQGILIAERRLRPLAVRDVVADRDVLLRVPAFVEKRDDGRVHPVEGSVLGAIADLAAPDLAARNRGVQLLEELHRMQAGIEDPMVLSDKFLHA